MDGVLIRGRERLAGSLELLALFKELGKPCILLTNDGSRSKVERAGLLARRGIEVPPSDIVCSSDGLEELVTARPALRELRYYIVGKLGNPCYAEAAGLAYTRELTELPACGGVIMGEGERIFDWETTFTAIINFFAHHHGAPLIVPNPDEYYPVTGGELRVGAGGQARFMQAVLTRHGTPAELICLGKPYEPIYAHVHRVLERKAGRPLERRRVLMMGDSLHSDIQGGLGFGYRTALLLTGITREAVLNRELPQPELVFRHL